MVFWEKPFCQGGAMSIQAVPRWHFFSRNRGKWIRAKPLAPTRTSSSPSFLSCPPTRSNIPPERTLAEDNKLFRTKLLIKKVGRECIEPSAKDQNSFPASPTSVVTASLKTNARDLVIRLDLIRPNSEERRLSKCLNSFKYSNSNADYKLRRKILFFLSYF